MGGPRPCVRNTGHNSFPTGVPFPHLLRACTGVGLLLTPQAGSVRSNLGQTSWARDTAPRPGRKENSQELAGLAHRHWKPGPDPRHCVVPGHHCQWISKPNKIKTPAKWTLVS